MFPQDGPRATAENALLAAVARPCQDTRRSRARVRFVPLVHLRHAPRVSCSGSVAVCAALGEEAVSYQQPPEQRASAPAGAPPGWYPDPGGLQARRWWDGAQWSPFTQPLSGAAQEPSFPILVPPGPPPADMAHSGKSAPGGTGSRAARRMIWRTRRTGILRAVSCFIPARPAAAAGSVPAARMAATAGLCTGTAASRAPRTAAAGEPQGPEGAHRPRNLDRDHRRHQRGGRAQLAIDRKRSGHVHSVSCGLGLGLGVCGFGGAKTARARSSRGGITAA